MYTHDTMATLNQLLLNNQGMLGYSFGPSFATYHQNFLIFNCFQSVWICDLFIDLPLYHSNSKTYSLQEGKVTVIIFYAMVMQNCASTVI